MLLLQNRTTYEYIRAYGDNKLNPRGNGIRTLFKLCETKGPSYVHHWKTSDQQVGDRQEHSDETVYALGNRGIAELVPLEEFDVSMLLNRNSRRRKR